MKINALLATGIAGLLCGCGMPAAMLPSGATAPTITSVVPSATGIPNSVVSFGNFAFVSVQGTGQIFTYNTLSGTPVQAGVPYLAPCAYPSGMVIVTIAGNQVMAIPCYDSDSLITLSVHGDGSLSALGTVGGLPAPYPGIASDGTDVFVPLYGKTLQSNGGVAKVSLAAPATPTITGVATLVSPAPGVFANPGYLAVANGSIFLAAGSESVPQATSSTLQVVNEASMTLVGKPLAVDHSPQQIAVMGNVAYMTFYGATQLQSIDISDPAIPRPLQTLSLVTPSASCHAVAIAVREIYVYAGCYVEGIIQRVNASDPRNMQISLRLTDISHPQRLQFSGHYLLVTDSVNGGVLYQVDTGAF